MANVPQLKYDMSPTSATVSTTQNFMLTITNPSTQFPVTVKRAGDQISVANWSSLTANVGQISPIAPVSTNWRAGLAGSFIKIFVIADTVIPAGGSVSFQINNVGIDANVGQGKLTVFEVIGGVAANAPDIPIGKLGSDLQIFAYANPVTVGLGQKTMLNWTIVKGLYVTVVPPDDGRQYPREGTGPYSFAVAAQPFQDARQTTFTLTVYQDIGTFVSTPVTINLSEPVITMLANDPSTPISIDEPLTLSWNSVYATTATLAPSTGGINVPTAGTRTYTASQLKRLATNNTGTLVFTLTANGYKGPVSQQLVLPLQPVTINWFRYADFDHAGFTYDVSNATNVSLPALSGPPPYLLRAEGPLGPVSQVLGGTGVEVLVLNADPDGIMAGDSAAIDFQVQRAASALLNPGGIPLQFDGNGVGRTVVSPTITTTYTLVATDAAGNQASSPVTVVVAAKRGRMTTKRKKNAPARRGAKRAGKGAGR